MANQSQAAGKPAREPRFLLGKFFVDADVVAEPEEPAKIVVAGMAEARIKKEYPEGYFKKPERSSAPISLYCSKARCGSPRRRWCSYSYSSWRDRFSKSTSWAAATTSCREWA